MAKPRSPSIALALTAALRSAPVGPEGKATVALARRYAALIEDAERSVQELIDLQADDEDVRDAIRRLRAKLEAQVVTSDLGPKLLAALTALGMTGAAAAAALKGGAPVAAHPALDELRQRRARLFDPPAVDSSAP
jgi:hypothetical protein